jgi:hypothetical protein
MRRAEALFKTMTTDFLLREQFVTDPVTIFYEYVHRTKLPPEQADASNNLMFAFFSSRPLLLWFHDNLKKTLHHPLSHQAFRHQFIRAVTVHRADLVVMALLHSSLHGYSLRGFADDLPFFVPTNSIIERGMLGRDGRVSSVGSAFADTDQDPTSPDPQTGSTEPDPQTGTTTPDPQTGTTTPSPFERPGDDDLVFFAGVDFWARPLNALTQYAINLRASGELERAVTI